MPHINLLPATLVKRDQIMLRLRWWAVAWVVSGLLALAPVALYSLQSRREARLLKERDAINRQLEELRGSLVTGNATIKSLQSRIASRNALRSKRDWAGLLRFTDACLPDEVWLTGALADNASGNGVGMPTTDDASIRLAGARRMVLRGYALDHPHLYTFMARLSDAGVFNDVELVHSGREGFLAGEAVRFELTCTW